MRKRLKKKKLKNLYIEVQWEPVTEFLESPLDIEERRVAWRYCSCKELSDVYEYFRGDVFIRRGFGERKDN